MASPSVWASVQNEPILPTPLGAISNLTDPESGAIDIYIIAGSCLSLIVLSAAVRLYTKVLVLKKWTWDDVTFVLGLSASLTYICLTIVAASEGVVGTHLWNATSKESNTKQLVLSVLLESIYGPCIWFVKLSLFVFYLYVFGSLRWLRYSVYAGAITTGLFYFVVMITHSVLCSPSGSHTSLAYVIALGSPRCAVTLPLIITLGVVSLVSDLYLIILPLPVVWQLQLPLRRKIAVSAMFFTGSIACVASAFALACRIQISREQDVTCIFVPLVIVTNIEFTAGIVVCCMPSTVAAFKSFKALLASTIDSHRRPLRLISTSENPRDYEMKSTANNQPTYRHRKHKKDRIIANNVTDTSTGSEDSRVDRQLDYHTSSPFAFDDTAILKTTDVQVTRQSRA